MHIFPIILFVVTAAILFVAAKVTSSKWARLPTAVKKPDSAPVHSVHPAPASPYIPDDTVISRLMKQDPGMTNDGARKLASLELALFQNELSEAQLSEQVFPALETKIVKKAAKPTKSSVVLKNMGSPANVTKLATNARIQKNVPMQIVVSLVFLGASIYIILSRSFDLKDKQWAYGSAGTILGYWLK